MNWLKAIGVELSTIETMLEQTKNDLKTCNSLAQGIELENRVEKIGGMLEKVQQDLLH